ncbi:putative outer membrane protein [Moritella sp. JT01]|uniref:porin n=1 Tax=Moritella sp. JT01 TaxID=756698 RepID=UPI00079366B6|nr:porin [Moritella sp. JT01]KXO13024.1 putative outer membrane protein [Moritella sp. JT01]
MKKTILATAILLAGAANAAEVYNNEGTSVSLGGSFRGHVLVNDKDNVKFEDAGSRFDIKASKELSEGVKAFGQMEIKYKDVNSLDTLYINNAFVGFEHDVYGKLVLGKKLGLNDDLVMNDFSYENGVYNHQNAEAGSDTQDQLEYTKTFGGASVVVGLMDKDTYSIGGTYDVAGLSLGVAYNIKNDNAATNNSDNSALIVGAQYSLDALTLGAQYQTLEVDNVDTSAYGFGVHYALGQAGVYAMYDILEVAKVDGSELVIGADYEIVKDVKTFIEFNSSDTDTTSSDQKVAIGGRVYF